MITQGTLTCLFSKLVLHSIKVRSHCNFLKPFLVYVVKIMEGHVKNVGSFRCDIQVSYVAVRQRLEILINGFLIKKLSVGDGEWWWKYFGWWWVVVDVGGWWWIYFGW